MLLDAEVDFLHRDFIAGLLHRRHQIGRGDIRTGADAGLLGGKIHADVADSGYFAQAFFHPCHARGTGHTGNLQALFLCTLHWACSCHDQLLIVANGFMLNLTIMGESSFFLAAGFRHF